MEFETTIRCQGLEDLSKSRLSLVDLNDLPTDPANSSEKFMVRITKLDECKKIGPDNRCNLTGKNCIFRDLPPIESENIDEEDFDDQSYF
ncbi:MAG TPA: hypothetical protein PKI92_01520 [Candidatus Woesebacteria bacterium]|nr:hypothetical protein [Candidatus Woesebacteria bacterium]HPR99650.1 hypothetical protein [Candidatus Woesebacteria bacterium]